MKLETICVHGGSEYDPATQAQAVPIYRTTAYLFKDTEHAANLFGLRELGNIYTRLMNPTTDRLERRMAELEGGAGALALSSGTSGVFYSLINICRAGDEVVSAGELYGGTYTQFNDILPHLGINVKFVDESDPKNFEAAITPKTKALFCEVVSNPSLRVVDMEALAQVAHAHGIPLIVDATFASPWLQRPFEHGADIVVHSLTKWLGGHGTGIGGVVVDSGKFNWQSDKFPLMTEPEPSYHGLRWAYDLPEPLAPLAYILRMRTIPLRNLGACISPDNAWMFMQGIETLPLRVDRQCENALTIAKHLQTHPKVEWVRYPLIDHPKECGKYLSGRGGSIVVFGIKGGKENGRKFIDSLGLFHHVANVGDAKSLAIHPATTTHSQLTDEQQKEAGAAPELVRLSLGIEHPDDLIQDVDQALEKSGK